jgi:hypothetical protein
VPLGEILLFTCIGWLVIVSATVVLCGAASRAEAAASALQPTRRFPRRAISHQA